MTNKHTIWRNKCMRECESVRWSTEMGHKNVAVNCVHQRFGELCILRLCSTECNSDLPIYKPYTIPTFRDHHLGPTLRFPAGDWKAVSCVIY